jgi:hypothetical protein
VGPRRRVPVMKHSPIVRVTRLSHPKEFNLSYAFSFGFRLGHPKEFNLSYAFSFEFRLGHPKAFEFS